MQISNLPSTNQYEKLERYFPLALVILCGVVFFYGLGNLPFIGPDEPRYAEVAREMYVSGDWITTRLGGIKWFEKPALTYWLSALGYSLFGENEFGARFFIAVFATLGVFLIFWFGQRIRSLRFGYLSAAALTTCGLWPGFARGATFDLPLAVTMALAMVSFFVWEQREEAEGRNRFWWLMCFALGLAVLAKGLVGLVLPAAIIGVYLLLTRGLLIVFKPKLLLIGSAIFLATVSTWYAPMIAINGREFINEFFIAHHFQRYLSNKYKHPQPFYFFFVVALAGSFPWTFFLISNVWQSLRNWRVMLQDRLRLFLWSWVMVTILFFSFSGSKLPGYVLPIFPAIALLIGLELEKFWQAGDDERMPRLAILTALLVLITGVAAIFVSQRELGAAPGESWLMGILTIVIAVIYLAVLFWNDARLATLVLPFSLIALIVAATHLVFPALGHRESFRDLAQTARRMAMTDERLIFFVNEDHGINFYATDLPLRDTKSELVTTNSPANIALMIAASKTKSMLVISRKRWSDGVTNSDKLVTEKLGEHNFNARCSPECDWVLLRARRKQ
ncbi:MAG: ArnT family glycosyltransferase [Blastocatellales bacterium]